MQDFHPEVERMPRERLSALQLVKLQNLLQHIVGRNRFYGKKFREAGALPLLGEFRSLDDLSSLPFTNKSELVQAQEEDPPFGTNATYASSEYTRVHQTSGTTGTPLRVVDTEQSWDWWGTCWRHVYHGAGVTAADHIFLPFSFGPFIGFWAAVEGARQIGAMMIPGGGWDSPQRLRMMHDLEATVVCCTPTYALRLAEVAREEKFDLHSLHVRALIHAGEPGANIVETKARIEAAWGAKCFDHAGASEVGAHSFECELQPGGIHINESEFIAEVIDPNTGEKLAAGEFGELVITNLGRLGYPVIRYRTGDLVHLHSSPCACGRTFALLEGGLLGRLDDMVTIRGVNVYPTAIENIIRKFSAVSEFQVLVTMRDEMHHLEIQIEVREDAGGVRAELERALYQALSLRATVTVTDQGTLPHYELKSRHFRRLDRTRADQPG